MLGLNIFVRVQTFRQAPLTRLRNSCHPDFGHFDHQCFAERESILKRQFYVVEQYSDFSLQKHFMETRVAEVARARERRSPKSLDSDENFKLFCRDIKIRHDLRIL